MILADNFDYGNLDQGGWQVYSHGDGEGRALIIHDGYSADPNNLALFAESKGEPYLTSVSRRIYISNVSNVVLFLDLRLALGFGPNDSLMLIISDDSRINLTRTQLSIPGTYELNLSSIWQNQHETQLPKSFYVELVNYDFDGVENKAYINSMIINASYMP